MTRAPSARRSLIRLACLAAVAALPGPASGQSGEWPTLSRAAIEYLSRSGAVQVTLSGQLDVEGIHTTNGWSGLVSLQGGADVLSSSPEDCSECHGDEPLTSTSGALVAHRLRLFADIFLGDHVYSLVELRADRGESPTDGKGRARVEQAFVRVGNRDGTRWVQAGVFASPFGSYPLRHLSVVDPFVRPPLGYDYRTVMSRVVAPGDEAVLLDWKDDAENFRRTGVPPVWDVPYQWGGMAFTQLAGIDLRVAATNSAPSSAPDAWLKLDRLDNPTWIVAARTRPTIDLELGASWSKGPWMEEFTVPEASPEGFRAFDQEIVAADVAFARGATMLRAEVMLDRWAVPNIAEKPTERVYHLEIQRDIVAGVFAAGRLGHIDFRPLARAGEPESQAEDWDRDVTRIEVSLGYRLVRNAGLLLSAYQQFQRDASYGDGRVIGTRLWWAF